MNKDPRLAVSIIFKVNDKVFYIKRQNFLKAFPGYSAFPGGKKDKSDLNIESCAIREIREELDFDLEKDDLKLIAKATSPDFNPSRYETYFYLVELSSEPCFNVDKREALEFGWKTPEKILREYYDGKRLMIYPIRKVLEKLIKDDYEFHDFDSYRFYGNEIPHIETIYGIKQFMPLSNTVPPAMRTNCFVIGDDKKTVIDPSPKNQDEYLKLKNELKAFDIEQVFITHHQFDHHQFAVKLANDFNIPLKISEDSFQRINQKAKNYFNGIEVQIVGEGHKLCSWLREDVTLLAIPGHDEGHMALAPKSMAWMIVGDLFQGIGTVVVGGDEGDMQKYMQSLIKVIEMRPNCVIPSHGIALGGTFILEKTLEHRKLREKQILDLRVQGKKTEEILEVIYFNIPEKIKKYAKANIESHLKKLKAEKKIS